MQCWGLQNRLLLDLQTLEPRPPTPSSILALLPQILSSWICQIVAPTGGAFEPLPTTTTSTTRLSANLWEPGDLLGLGWGSGWRPADRSVRQAWIVRGHRARVTFEHPGEADPSPIGSCAYTHSHKPPNQKNPLFPVSSQWLNKSSDPWDTPLRGCGLAGSQAGATALRSRHRQQRAPAKHVRVPYRGAWLRGRSRRAN